MCLLILQSAAVCMMSFKHDLIWVSHDPGRVGRISKVSMHMFLIYTTGKSKAGGALTDHPILSH